MWGWSFLILVGVFLWQANSHGVRHALGVSILLALLVPAWVVMGYQRRDPGFQPLGIPIDMRAAIGFLGILACCARPRSIFPTRLVLADLMLISLVSIHILSDWNNEGFSIAMVLRALGEWAVPYFVGSIAIQNIDDVKRLLPYAVCVGVILASLALLESAMRYNFPEFLFGERPIDEMPRMMLRWGLKRAYCTANHPIFFGALLLLLSPWAFYASVRAARAAKPAGLLIALIVSGGILATMSRGPSLALGIMVYGATLLIMPQWRKSLILCGALVSLLVVVQFESTLNALHLWSGESGRKRVQTINIDGVQLEHSGTLTRIYLLEVYGEAIRRAGLLGFGTERVTGFPVRVPVGPELTDTLKKVPWIDNVYVLMILRFGYLGVAAFLLLGIAGTACFVLEAISRDEGYVFYAYMAGALFATMLLMLTVWMPRDFGFLWLMSVGAGAGIRSKRLLDRCPASKTLVA